VHHVISSLTYLSESNSKGEHSQNERTAFKKHFKSMQLTGSISSLISTPREKFLVLLCDNMSYLGSFLLILFCQEYKHCCLFWISSELKIDVTCLLSRSQSREQSSTSGSFIPPFHTLLSCVNAVSKANYNRSGWILLYVGYHKLTKTGWPQTWKTWNTQGFL